VNKHILRMPSDYLLYVEIKSVPEHSENPTRIISERDPIWAKINSPL